MRKAIKHQHHTLRLNLSVKLSLLAANSKGSSLKRLQRILQKAHFDLRLLILRLFVLLIAELGRRWFRFSKEGRWKLRSTLGWKLLKMAINKIFICVNQKLLATKLSMGKNWWIKLDFFQLAAGDGWASMIAFKDSHVASDYELQWPSEIIELWEAFVGGSENPFLWAESNFH